MLDITLLREDPNRVKKGIVSKNIDPKLVDDFLFVDRDWRAVVKNIDELRAEQKKAGLDRDMTKAMSLKNELRALEGTLKELGEKRDAVLYRIPNLPLTDVPIGKNETGNIVVREVGEEPQFNFPPKDYLSLTKRLEFIDMERAAKVSGSRFGYLLRGAVLLEFALVRFAFDVLTNERVLKSVIKNLPLQSGFKSKITPTPFTPVIPPVLIKKEMMAGMGYMDRGADEIYYTQDGLYLVGTSEQVIGSMHVGEIFNARDLPRRYVAFSTCFRREAGSHGKDTKGILRVHQFDKVEMFSLVRPEDSESEHQLLLALEEYLMQKLELPYRVVQICTGDLGDPAAAKYDIETWLPGQNNGKGEYRETHSTSNTTDFQSRRLNIRYRKKSDGRDLSSEVNYVHTLNGTAFAIGRMIIAIIENCQTKNGEIAVPKALQKYIGGKAMP